METTLSLEVPPDVGYVRVLTTAAETLAGSCGLASREQMRFQLAVEEFFTYLARALPHRESIRITLTGRVYQVCASFRFKATGLSLGALNACCPAVSTDGVDGGDSLSLILAGRVADRFRIDREGGDVFILQAEVDKVYPPGRLPSGNLAIRRPYRSAVEQDASRLMYAAGLAASRYPAWHCPASFQTPAKFADMSRYDRFRSVVVLDGASHPAGLLCWSSLGDKSLAFSGPFVFAQAEDGPEVARLLTDAFLAAVAREKADIVFSERATADVPPGYFESLGTLTFHGRDGALEQPVLYRHLREDAGETVWIAPELADFLHRTYDRLAMCREVVTAHPPAAYEREQSLFCATLDSRKGLAVLRPLLDGEDVLTNLANHVRAFSEKGMANILLYLDLSRAWEAALAETAMRGGFWPRLVLPCAGRSDLLVLQHEHAD